MDTRLAKAYGIPLVAAGTLLLCVDVAIMSFGSDIINAQINPVKMFVDFLDNLVALNTSIGAVLASHFFIFLAIASGIAFFYSLSAVLNAPREAKNFLPLYITGGLSLLFWFIHALCIGRYFIVTNWESESFIRYYEKKFICIEFLLLSLFFLLSTVLLFFIPSRKAKNFCRFLQYGLLSAALLCSVDIMLFGLINVVFHKESISVLPYLSFIAACLVGSGAYVLQASPGLLHGLQEMDRVLHFSAIAGPVVFMFDRAGDSSTPPTGTESAPTVVQESGKIPPSLRGSIEPIQSPPGDTGEKKQEAAETEKAEAPAAGIGPAMEAALPAMKTAPLEKDPTGKETLTTAPLKESTTGKESLTTAPLKESTTGKESLTTAPREETSRHREPLKASPLPAAPARSAAVVIALVIGLLCILTMGTVTAWYFTSGPGRIAPVIPSLSPVPGASIIPAATPSAHLSPAASETPRPSPSAEARLKILPESGIAYTDISECTFRRQIIGLARLGIFDRVSGEFRPNDPIIRSEYIRWLVKANNAYFPVESGNFIKVAQSGDSTFTDVEQESTDWKWIQGMANAGYIIGYDELNFKPGKELSREEMMAIRCGLEYTITSNDIERIEKNLDVYRKDLEERFNDASKIERKYVASYFKDMDNAFMIFRSAFGSTRILLPQKKLTREEAAATIWTIRGHKGETLLNR